MMSLSLCLFFTELCYLYVAEGTTSGEGGGGSVGFPGIKI